MMSHPQLNDSMCFQESLQSQSIAEEIRTKYTPPDQWLDSFASLIHANLTDAKKKKITITLIRKALADHIEPGCDKWLYYRSDHKKELERALILIFAVWSKSIIDPSIRFNPDEAKSSMLIAEKLEEGLFSCTPGFHNRVNMIWMSWLIEKNFVDRLAKIRDDIVHRVSMNYLAINLSDNVNEEVHVYNMVSRIAAPRFGTTPINEDDQYGGTFNTADIVERLERAFSLHYTPLGMIKGIEEQLYSELTYMAEYHGYDSDGYAGYEKWNTILNTAFPSTESRGNLFWLMTNAKTEEEFSELDDPRIFDVNWPLIRRAIFERLQEEGFLLPNTTTKSLFRAETSTIIEFNYWAVNFATISDLRSNFHDLLKKQPTNQLRTVSVFFMALPADHPFKEELLQTISQNERLFLARLLDVFYRKMVTPDFVVAALERLSPKTAVMLMAQEIEPNTNFLTLVIERGSPDVVTRFLGLLGRYQLEESLLCVWSQLIKAFKKSDQAIPTTLQSTVISLINGIAQFSPSIQIRFFQMLNPEGVSIIEYAQKYIPNWVTLLEHQIANLIKMIRDQTLYEQVPVLQIIKFHQLQLINPDDILEILRSKNFSILFKMDTSLNSLQLSSDEEVFLNKILKDEHWYAITKEALLPMERVKHKKREICDYIIKKLTDSNERAKAIQDALDQNTALGQFFDEDPSMSGACFFRQESLLKRFRQAEKRLNEDLIRTGNLAR